MIRKEEERKRLLEAEKLRVQAEQERIRMQAE